MSTYNTYEVIAQGATEAEAREIAQCLVWSEIEISEQNIGHADFVDTVNDIDIYYDFGADYYFFTPSN